jgi:dynein light chain LC8-type
MSDEARRGGPAGAAQAVVRASSEDRKPVGAGSPPPAAAAAAVAAHKIQLKSADMKEEMRQEAFEIARVVRALRPRSRSAISLPALDLGFSSLRPF